LANNDRFENNYTKANVASENFERVSKI